MARPLPIALRPLVPLVTAWIERRVERSRAESRPLDAALRTVLEGRFYTSTLQRVRVVVADQLPSPPVPTLGLARLRQFKRGDYAGLTLQDTVFIRRDHAGDTGLLVHELVHVVQWARLGPRAFVDRYARELLEHGYGQAPLERVAYAHEARFRAGERYDAETEIQRALDRA